MICNVQKLAGPGPLYITVLKITASNNDKCEKDLKVCKCSVESKASKRSRFLELLKRANLDLYRIKSPEMSAKNCHSCLHHKTTLIPNLVHIWRLLGI